MWTIQRDLLFEEDPAGLTSSFGTSGSLTVGDDGNGRVRFRLFDDDGILYYEGVLDDDDEGRNQLEALSWGMHDAGCTTIKVKRPLASGDSFDWIQEIG